jgi:hypothetical protein
VARRQRHAARRVSLRAARRLFGQASTLVVYIHPSLFTADTIPFATNLLEFMPTADVSGDPARPGFILLAPQDGRRRTSIRPPTTRAPAGTIGIARSIPRAARVSSVGVCIRRTSMPRRSITSSPPRWRRVKSTRAAST